MALAQFKDLCIDAVDVPRAVDFWAAALGLAADWDEPEASLAGPTDRHRIWVNEVPEPKRAKNRIHLDVHAASLADLAALGARVLEPQAGDRGWTVLAAPDGQEFCAFLRAEPPAYRLYEVVADAADSQAVAGWWAEVFGVEVRDGKGYHYLSVPGAPFEALTFVPVPEPKTVKNRVHWDVLADRDALLAAGATLLRARDAAIRWDVLADPEGNEFCAFAE